MGYFIKLSSVVVFLLALQPCFFKSIAAQPLRPSYSISQSSNSIEGAEFNNLVFVGEFPGRDLARIEICKNVLTIFYLGNEVAKNRVRIFVDRFRQQRTDTEFIYRFDREHQGLHADLDIAEQDHTHLYFQKEISVCPEMLQEMLLSARIEGVLPDVDLEGTALAYRGYLDECDSQYSCWPDVRGRDMARSCCPHKFESYAIVGSYLSEQVVRPKIRYLTLKMIAFLSQFSRHELNVDLP